MKLKDLIVDAAVILGIKAEEDSENFKVLMRCANIAAADIACNYQDSVASQTFTVTNGQVDFKKFRKTFFKIKSVQQNGRDVYYDLYTNFIGVPNGAVTVEYAYVPKFQNGGNRIAGVMGWNCENVLLYGMLTEYCLVSMLNAEAKYYSAKFEQMLFVYRKTGHAKVMK